jgi:hypothetical protein
MHESAFPRKRLVKICTKRYHGNVAERLTRTRAYPYVAVPGAPTYTRAFGCGATNDF